MRQLVLSMASESGRSPSQILNEWNHSELIELVAFRNMQADDRNESDGQAVTKQVEIDNPDSLRSFFKSSGIGVKDGESN